MSGLLHGPDDQWRAPLLCVSDEGGPPVCTVRTGVSFQAPPGPAARRCGLARPLCLAASSCSDGVCLGACLWGPLASTGVAGPERGAPQRAGHLGDPDGSAHAGVLGRYYPLGGVSATTAGLGRENASVRYSEHPVSRPSGSASRGNRTDDVDRVVLSASTSRITRRDIRAEAPID